MDAEMALVRVSHAFIQSCCVSRHPALKRGASGSEIFRELARIMAVQLPLDYRRNLPDLYRRQGHPNAVERIGGIARIADDVPAIGRIALAAFPHVGAVEIRVHDRAAAR